MYMSRSALSQLTSNASKHCARCALNAAPALFKVLGLQFQTCSFVRDSKILENFSSEEFFGFTKIRTECFVLFKMSIARNSGKKLIFLKISRKVVYRYLLYFNAVLWWYANNNSVNEEFTL